MSATITSTTNAGTMSTSARRSSLLSFAALSFLKHTQSAMMASNAMIIAALSPCVIKLIKVLSLTGYCAKLRRFSIAFPPETMLSAKR